MMVERWGYLWVREVLQPKFAVSDGPISKIGLDSG